jgi:hypothetical protein
LRRSPEITGSGKTAQRWFEAVGIDSFASPSFAEYQELAPCMPRKFRAAYRGGMRGGGISKAVTLSFGFFARAYEAAQGRVIVPTKRPRIHKSKAPDCSRAFRFRGNHSSRMNVNICCRFSEQPWPRNLRLLDPMDSPRRLSWHRCACRTLWSCLFRVSFSCQRLRRDRRFLRSTRRVLVGSELTQ